MKRVVITGIAPIAALGAGEAFFDRLMKMETVIKKIDNSYCNGSNISKFYVPYPELDITPYRSKLKKMPSLASENAITAVISTIMALNDAKIDIPDPDTAVFYGVSTMNAKDIIDSYVKVMANKKLHPSSNPKVMSNAIPAWISIIFDIHGRSQSFATACSSGTDAIGAAYEYISSGRGKCAICGGADYMKSDEEMIFRSFDVLSALTKSQDGLPRPFSEERSGFLFCEGSACTLILEEYESAIKRNAEIYAEISGYNSRCDAFHIVKMPEYPEQAVKMLKDLIGDKKIDYYNAHGTATDVNDQMELSLLKEVFAEKLPEVIIGATKGITGHSIGASGAIEAAVCAYSIKKGVIHGNITGTPLKGLNLPDKTLNADIKCAISTSFGFGGHDSALMFEKI